MSSNCDEYKSLSLLQSHGIDTCKYSQISMTALSIVCFHYKNESLALSILEFPKINYNHIDYFENTALIYACDPYLENVALKLLHFDDINYNHVNNSGNSALIYACENKMEKVALKLLEKKDININQRNTLGYTALIYACENKMEKVALKLLEKENINYNEILPDPPADQH